MAKGSLSLMKSDKVLEATTVKQQKEINAIYSRSYKKIAKEIKKLEGKKNISSILQTQELKKLKGIIAKEYDHSRALVKDAIEKNMDTVSSAVVKDNIDFAKKIGVGIKGAFTNVPRDVVRNVITGKVYQEDWTLSKALWGDDKKKLKEIDRIIAEGIVQNKSAYDIAKDLEMYVNPNAKKPWDWGKVYPGTRKKIDYNAQRLARTLVNHAYQQSVIETAKPNPFIEGIKWLSAYAHGRTCELCMSRASEDNFGLGAGVFPKDQVPLDHPNGLCTLAPVIVDDMEKIADRLADWARGKEDPELDKYANALYGEKKFESVKKEIIKNQKEADKPSKALTEEETMDMIYEKFYSVPPTTKANEVYDMFSPEDLKIIKSHGINLKKEIKDFGFKGAISKAELAAEKAKEAAKIAERLNESAEQTIQRINNALENQTLSMRSTKRYLDERFDDWILKTTPKERTAIEDYTGNDYKSMNAIMRGTSRLDKNSFSYKSTLSKVNDAISALDKATLEKDMCVRRGASTTSFAGMFGTDAYNEAKSMGGKKWIDKNKDSLLGQIVKDDGFLSTTPFIGKGFTRDVDFRIELPKGTKAMYIAPMSRYADEEEVLVQAGTQYIITDIKKEGGYVVYLKAIVK